MLSVSVHLDLFGPAETSRFQMLLQYFLMFFFSHDDIYCRAAAAPQHDAATPMLTSTPYLLHFMTRGHVSSNEGHLQSVLSPSLWLSDLDFIIGSNQKYYVRLIIETCLLTCPKFLKSCLHYLIFRKIIIIWYVNIWFWRLLWRTKTRHICSIIIVAFRNNPASSDWPKTSLTSVVTKSNLNWKKICFHQLLWNVKHNEKSLKND